MKNKLISLFIVGVVGLSLIGCGKNKSEYKSISGTVIDTSEEHGFRTMQDYITLKTDNGNIKFKCNESIYKAVSKDLKITIKYDDDFYIQSIDIGNPES